MQKLKKLMATVLVLTVILGMEVLGATFDSTYTLLAGTKVNVVCNKSTDLDYFGYRLYDVYPNDSNIEDTYKRIKISATDRYGNSHVNERVISESTTTSTIPALLDLSKTDYVFVYLSGNDPTLSAKAHIYVNFY